VLSSLSSHAAGSTPERTVGDLLEAAKKGRTDFAEIFHANNPTHDEEILQSIWYASDQVMQSIDEPFYAAVERVSSICLSMLKSPDIRQFASEEDCSIYSQHMEEEALAESDDKD
jgi:hypothetical protein